MLKYSNSLIPGNSPVGDVAVYMMLSTVEVLVILNVTSKFFVLINFFIISM